MTHEQFIHAYKLGACIPRIEPAQALQFMFSHRVNNKIRLTFYIWFIIWLLLVGLTIYFFGTGSIMNGLVIIVFAYFLPDGMFRYSADYIISRSLEDESFYQLITGLKIMLVNKSRPVSTADMNANQSNLSHQ